MTRWAKPNDEDARIRKIEQRIVVQERSASYAGTFTPTAPAAPTVTFEIKEFKTHAEYRAVVSWAAGSANVCQADVDYYVVEIQPTNGSGTPQGNGHIRHGNVKGSADPLQGVFNNVENPKRWYWRARVKLVDQGHRESAYGAWSTEVLPTAEADPVPPTPTGIAVSYDTAEKTRTSRIDGILRWTDIGNWDIPGYDREGDVARYNVEMLVCDSGGTTLVDSNGNDIVRSLTVPSKGGGTVTARFKNLSLTSYYRFRVRSGDRYGRKGAWSTPTAVSTPSDATVPPAPTNVDAWSSIARVGVQWDAVVDGNDEWDIDIDHFEVQVADKRDFSNIVKKARYVADEQWSWHTKLYKKQYWFRVRAVDASGNASSSWASAPSDGPVRPLQAQGKRSSEPDIDWSSGEGFDLGGKSTNRAYIVSGAVRAAAWIAVNTIDGDLEGDITLSPTADSTKAGYAFRLIDASNYLFAIVDTVTASNQVALYKHDGGAASLLGTAWIPAAGTISDGDTYTLKITLSGNSVTVYVDGTSRITHTLAGGDATKYGTGTTTTKNVGLFADLGGDEKHRWDTIKWTNSGETSPELDDNFDRTASASSLGVAVSGQTWVPEGSTTWGISADAAGSDAIYGMGVAIPIFFGQDATSRTGRTVPYGTSDPLKMGEGGQDTPAMELYVDRPVKITLWGNSATANENDGNDMNLSFFLMYSDDGGTTLNVGRQSRAFQNAGDKTNNRYRHISNMRQIYYDGSAGATLSFYWGYRIGGAASRQFTIENQKMLAFVSYAPDYVDYDADPDSTINTRAVSRRTLTRRRYGKAEGND